MFFSEAGGFVWLIKDADKNPKVRARSEEEVTALKFN